MAINPLVVCSNQTPGVSSLGLYVYNSVFKGATSSSSLARGLNLRMSAVGTSDRSDFSSLTLDTAGGSFFSDSLRNGSAQSVFQVASYLTDPLCKAHEYYWRLAVVDSLNPTACKISNLIRKVTLCVGIMGWASLAVVTSLPAIGLRVLGSYLQKEPFIYVQGSGGPRTLPSNRSFSLLSWNICCVGAGYSISDGGVLPWSFRIDEVVEKMIEKDADVNCLYETFDSKSAFYICDRLKSQGFFIKNVLKRKTRSASREDRVG